MVRVEVEAFAAAVGESARAFEDALPAVAAMSRRTNRTAIAAMEIVRLGVDTGIIADLKAGRAVQHALAAFAELARGAISALMARRSPPEQAFGGERTASPRSCCM